MSVPDLPVPADVTRAIAEAEARFGRIDILVTNAGGPPPGPFESHAPEAWQRAIALNLDSVVNLTRAVLPGMKARGEREGFGGHIVNVASVAALLGNPRIGAYNATKFGLRGLSDALMKEVREYGIKVTCIYPGSIATEFFRTSGSTPSANPMTAEDVASTVLHVVETPDNYLVSEVVMRPLRPGG